MDVDGLSHRELDITDSEAVERFILGRRPDLVINSAAHTAVDGAESEPEVAQRVNGDGARYVAISAASAGARLVHLSTDFVFDGASSVPYTPHAPTNPLNVYGLTKRRGEEDVARHGPVGRSVILRTAWVYSPHGTNFLRTMLKLMLADRPLRVVSDQIGTPTSASSVAAAIWKIAARQDLTGIQHWTDAGVASWYDFAVAIAEEAAAAGLIHSGVRVQPIRTDEYPTRARRPSYSVLDKSALWSALAAEPVHWRANLREVLKGMAHA
jgi:dTDP-4-dehydrorhamnose reductase